MGMDLDDADGARAELGRLLPAAVPRPPPMASILFEYIPYLLPPFPLDVDVVAPRAEAGRFCLVVVVVVEEDFCFNFLTALASAALALAAAASIATRSRCVRSISSIVTYPPPVRTRGEYDTRSSSDW